MRIILLICLLFQVSCATKYLVPTNRFLTPETQGGALRGQVEIQQTAGQQLTIDTSSGTADEGVTYELLRRSGFLFSNSFFDSFDLYWSHTGGANSMLGGKFQFIGAPRTANSAGHKMSLAAAVGGNEHETDDETVKFELQGREFLLLYGYRINANVFPYASLSYATYNFTGEVFSSDPVLNGLKPEKETTITSLSGGVELSLNAFFVKLEGTYQQLATAETKDKSELVFGYSLGFSW